MNGNVKVVLAVVAAIVFTGCAKNLEQNSHLPGNETEVNSLHHPGFGGKKRPVIISKAGMVDQDVEKFRELLGPLNWNATHTGGRKEVNWDDVVLALTNNNNFPGNYYNSTYEGHPYDRKRGIVFSTPGAGFRVSNNNFSDIDSLYSDEFVPFSPAKNVVALGSNMIEIHFKEPGTDKPGYVEGFGAVFSDVNLQGTTWVSLYSGPFFLGNYKVKIADTGEFSFLGIYLPGKKITRARIKLGTAALAKGVADVCDNGTEDLVSLDDVIYSTPRRFGFGKGYK